MRQLLKGAVVCERGLEDISVLEIKELIGVDGEAHDGVVVFPVNDISELCVLCYRAQSVKRVLLLLAEGEFADFFDEIGKNIKKTDVGVWVAEGATVLVECERMGTHDFTSSDASGAVGKAVVERVKETRGFAPTIDFDNPTTRFFLYIYEKRFYFGVDFGGFDLAQREYKVFSHAAALKGTVAYGVVRVVGFDASKFLLNVFSKSGMIEIETALFATGKAVNFYRKDKFAFWNLSPFAGKEADVFFADVDQKIKKEKIKILGVHGDLRHISAGKKNAKIAGVDKAIEFSRIDVDWLDVKFKEGEVDILVTQPAGREVEQMSELFRQAEYILADDGVMVVVSVGKSVADAAQKQKFVLKSERVLVRGETKLWVQVFKKE